MAFNKLDDNGDGYISVEEIVKQMPHDFHDESERLMALTKVPRLPPLLRPSQVCASRMRAPLACHRLLRITRCACVAAAYPPLLLLLSRALGSSRHRPTQWAFEASLNRDRGAEVVRLLAVDGGGGWGGQAKRAMREADTNGDGRVSREEFVALLLGSPVADSLDAYDARLSEPHQRSSAS